MEHSRECCDMRLFCNKNCTLIFALCSKPCCRTCHSSNLPIKYLFIPTPFHALETSRTIMSDAIHLCRRYVMYSIVIVIFQLIKECKGQNICCKLTIWYTITRLARAFAMDTMTTWTTSHSAAAYVNVSVRESVTADYKIKCVFSKVWRNISSIVRMMD